MSHSLRFLVWVCVVTLALLAGPALSQGQEIEWIRQFGTTDRDYGYGVASDPTGVYVAGYTAGTFPGQTPVGVEDAFLCKYDFDGTQLWCRQFGTTDRDYGYGVASDPTGVYVGGQTYGTFPGQTSAGNPDVFVCKYDPSGTQLWCRQFGTMYPGQDILTLVASHAGGVYLAGMTWGTFPGQTHAGDYDGFVCKYDSDGTQLWCRQFGSTTYEHTGGLASDATGVYVAGMTWGTFPGQTSAGDYDAYVCKYDLDGTQLWCRQFGTTDRDLGYGMASDPTGVYAAGYTHGTFPGETSAGDYDGFVCKYDFNGTQLWCRQFGTTEFEMAYGMASDPTGVYVAGFTHGTFPGQISAGEYDAFVCQYDSNGNQPWCRQFGTTDRDLGYDVASDASGVYVAGYTYGTFPGQISGGSLDAFVAKLAVSNEAPTADAGPDQTVACTSLAGTPVALDASGSSDPDDDSLTYAWTGPFPEGSGAATGVGPTVTLPLGASTITLVVNDATEDSAPDTVQVTVAVHVEGLQPPLEPLVPQGDPVLVPDKASKLGRTLPLKLQLFCGGTALTSADVAPPRIVGLVRQGDAPLDLEAVDLDAGTANDSGLLFRYSAPNWVYNLSTKSLAAGTYTITLQMPDGLNYTAAFVLK